MDKIAIICVDDEREVLEALLKDLEEFAPYFRIEPAESAEDAKEVINDLAKDEVEIGLILADHLMPGTSGVNLLIDLKSYRHTLKSRKVLITAQAGLEATIEAVNKANLDHYVRKPWHKDNLRKVVVEYLTDYVLENSANPMEYTKILDTGRILEALSKHRDLRDSYID